MGGDDVMYLLDWKIPRRLYGIRDELFEVYLDSGQGDVCTPKTKGQILTANNALSCFVYNASYHVSRGDYQFNIPLSKRHYSRPLIYNGNHVKGRKVSYKWTKNILDWMTTYNLIELSVGSVETYKDNGSRLIPDKVKRSSVTLSDGLVSQLKPVSSIEHQEILKNVLELRDDSGDLVPYRRYDKQEKLVSLLNTYNMVANVSDITVDSKDFHVQLKKVFNNDWSSGGRSYLVGAAITSELLKKENRGKVLIGGEKTTELDYKALHASIIAELEGHAFSGTFDPYGIRIEGYDDGCLRQIAKLAMLILINSDSSRQASQALSFEMFNKLPLQVWKDRGLIPDPVESKRVISKIYEHNTYAVKWYGERKGLYLQNIDSRILDIVIDYWSQRGVMVLPIHDSNVIQDKYVDEAREVMYYAYEKVLGSKINCKVEEK